MSVDEIQQISTITELRDNVVVLLVFKNLVQFDDVGVIQFLEDLELIDKA